MNKAILLSHHAKEQAFYRGCSEIEIIQAIQDSPLEKAGLGRLQCRKNFVYNAVWNGREYQTKQVNPIFMEENNRIIVVTVYVYYF